MTQDSFNQSMFWFGSYPKHWEIRKARYIFSLRSEKGNTRCLQLLSPTQQYGVIPQATYEERTGASTVKLDEKINLMGLRTIHKGDFCISLRSFQGGFEYSEYEGVVSPAYQVFYAKSHVNNCYYKYLFKTEAFIKKINSFTLSLRDGKNIAYSDFETCLIPVPPMDEQTRIVNFLESKCYEIDSLSSNIQKEIETLEAYKKSLITETVTKGLDSNVEFCGSSIDGIKTIPAHWTESKLNYEAYVRARLGWKGLKAEEYVDEGYAFISAFNIQNNKLVWEPLNYITKERYDESPEIKIHVGDVLLVKDGAGVGKSARVDFMPCGETAPNSSIGVITPYSNLEYRYLEYYLSSTVFSDFVLRLYNGMGVPHLTQEILKTLRLPLPPIKEQLEISDFLDSKCSELDSIISQKKEQLETLVAYKKSLIYEYVTGKKEVPAI